MAVRAVSDTVLAADPTGPDGLQIIAILRNAGVEAGAPCDVRAAE
jgi:hypothetical protein